MSNAESTASLFIGFRDSKPCSGYASETWSQRPHKKCISYLHGVMVLLSKHIHTLFLTSVFFLSIFFLLFFYVFNAYRIFQFFIPFSLSRSLLSSLFVSQWWNSIFTVSVHYSINEHALKSRLLDSKNSSVRHGTHHVPANRLPGQILMRRKISR